MYKPKSHGPCTWVSLQECNDGRYRYRRDTSGKASKGSINRLVARYNANRLQAILNTSKTFHEGPTAQRRYR